jgi:hypothetical protein
MGDTATGEDRHELIKYICESNLSIVELISVISRLHWRRSRVIDSLVVTLLTAIAAKALQD